MKILTYIGIRSAFLFTFVISYIEYKKGVDYMCNNNECSCNTNNCNTCNSCIAEILQVINVLQSNACPENCLNSCDRPALGGGANCIVCNTRPIMICAAIGCEE